METSNGNPKHFTIENVDLAAFINAIDNCKGPVILFTDEGDRFNLKSKLSQLAGIFNLIQGGKFVKLNAIESSENRPKSVSTQCRNCGAPTESNGHCCYCGTWN